MMIEKYIYEEKYCGKIKFNKQASEKEETQNWIFCPFGETDNMFGSNLSMLYHDLLYNLVNSNLGMVNLSKYIENIMRCKMKDVVVWQVDKKENQPITRDS